MALLHTVNKSPFDRASLSACLDHALPGSTVLLIEDGVYGAMRGTACEPRLRGAQDDVTICALEPDLLARGIAPGQMIEGIGLVDYAGFVDLAVRNDKVHAWL